MNTMYRPVKEQINAALARRKSVLLLGPRQTGKTTIINELSADFSLNLVNPKVRWVYEKDPGILIQEVESLAQDLNGKQPLIVIDEAQLVPELFNAAQDLIDRAVAQFVFSGSSARKLNRAGKINLLPGRIVILHLDPMTLLELEPSLPTLSELLLYGSLPGIMTLENEAEKEQDLNSYVSAYLEEEIRAEATVRNLGAFARFLEYAAMEAGNIVNLTKLSQQIGVAHTTIAAYYEILEDCLIAERIDPHLSENTRRRINQRPKYLFFDLGIRRVCAGEGLGLPNEFMGRLFEQFVGLQLISIARLKLKRYKLYYWRDANGPEVDWVLKTPETLIPIEVKYGQNPTPNDARHLELFMDEHQLTQGYIVSRVERKRKLSKRVQVIPWQQLALLVL